MALHEGTEGTVKAGPALTADEVAYLTEWEFETKTDTKENGPFINNPNKEKVRSGKSGEGTLKGFVPVDTDDGQSAIMDAQDDDEDIRLELKQTKGYTFTIANAIITSIKYGQKADEGLPFEAKFECGAWTRAKTVTP